MGNDRRPSVDPVPKASINQITPLKPVKCRDLPQEVAGFHRTICVNDDYVRYCRAVENDEICIDAINTDQILNLGGIQKTWVLKGFALLGDKNRTTPIEPVKEILLAQNKVVETVTAILKSLDDPVILQEMIKNAEKKLT